LKLAAIELRIALYRGAQRSVVAAPDTSFRAW
jgi:hypothetical protein